MVEALEKILDVILERIIAFSDYFIVAKHITLSETTLFAFVFSRGVWGTIFGIHMVADNPMLSSQGWTLVFLVLGIAHFISFFLSGFRIRIITLCAYGFVWCFLALLVAMTSYSMAIPTFLILAFLSAFLVVRLIKESRVGRITAG